MMDSSWSPEGKQQPVSGRRSMVKSHHRQTRRRDEGAGGVISMLHPIDFDRHERLPYQRGNDASRLLRSVLLSCLVASNAQTECACTPSVYTLTLDFALTCAETSVALSPGITDVVCNTNPNTSLDPATAQATSIQFLELDQSQKILRTDMITNVQSNGATLQYQSYISTSQTGQVDRVPGSLEIAIMARDATVTSIYQQLVIQFSNDCNVYPVLVPDQQIGWLKLASLEPPPAAYCPAAAGATEAPTALRTPAPTPSQDVKPSVKSSPRPTGSLKVPSPRPNGSLKNPTPRPNGSLKNPTPRPNGSLKNPTSKPLHPTHKPSLYCPPLPKSKKGHVFDFAFEGDGCYYPSSKVSKSKKGSKGSSKSAKASSKCSSSKGKGGKGKGGKGKGGGSSSKGSSDCPEPPAPHSSAPVKPPPVPTKPPPVHRPTNRPGSKAGVVYSAPPRTERPTVSANGTNQLQTLPPSDDDASDDDLQQSAETDASQAKNTLSSSSGGGGAAATSSSAPTLGRIAGYAVAGVACTLLAVGLFLFSRKCRGGGDDHAPGRRRQGDRIKRLSSRRTASAATTAAAEEEEESVPIRGISRGSASFSTRPNLQQPSRDEYSEIYMHEYVH